LIVGPSITATTWVSTPGSVVRNASGIGAS
jgi:hypothetical protein